MGKQRKRLEVVMVEEGLRDRDSERASGAGRLIVETRFALSTRAATAQVRTREREQIL